MTVVVIVLVIVLAKISFMDMWPLDIARRRVTHGTRITGVARGHSGTLGQAGVFRSVPTSAIRCG